MNSIVYKYYKTRKLKEKLNLIIQLKLITQTTEKIEKKKSFNFNTVFQIFISMTGS